MSSSASLNRFEQADNQRVVVRVRRRMLQLMREAVHPDIPVCAVSLQRLRFITSAVAVQAKGSRAEEERRQSLAIGEV